MDENAIKMLTKFVIDNGQRQFTTVEKELLKEAVDKATNINELLATIAMGICIDK
jgi:hypothetical protein